MDLQAIMPLLMNILGGGNTNLLQSLLQKPQNSQSNNIPQEVLASYPTNFTNITAPNQNNAQSATNIANNPIQNFDMLKNLMPLLQNINKQKNSPPKFSELKSVDEYIFD